MQHTPLGLELKAQVHGTVSCVHSTSKMILNYLLLQSGNVSVHSADRHWMLAYREIRGWGNSYPSWHTNSTVLPFVNTDDVSMAYMTSRGGAHVLAEYER
jgi:hypothetical protein